MKLLDCRYDYDFKKYMDGERSELRAWRTTVRKCEGLIEQKKWRDYLNTLDPQQLYPPFPPNYDSFYISGNWNGYCSYASNVNHPLDIGRKCELHCPLLEFCGGGRCDMSDPEKWLEYLHENKKRLIKWW